MKVKILKEIKQFPQRTNLQPWEIRTHFTDALIGGVNVPASILIEQGFIEEVKETPKPKFVVWEYVTCEYGDWTKKYLSISEIRLDSENEYEYNRYFSEKYLREPTREELQTYFA